MVNLVKLKKRKCIDDVQFFSPLGGSLRLVARRQITDADMKHLYKEIIQSCKWLEKALNACLGEGTLRFDCSILEKRLKSGNWSSHDKELFRPVILKSFWGYLSKEQCINVAMAVNSYFDDSNYQNNINIGIWGGCQGAKTILADILFLLIPVLDNLLASRLAIPFIQTPNSINICGSNIKELEAVYNCFCDVIVHYGDKSLKMSYVHDEILKVLGPSAGWDSLVMQRNPSQVKAYTEQIEKYGKEKNIETIIVNIKDEFHVGSAKGGMTDQFDQVCLNKRAIGISATPSETWTSPLWDIIPMVLDKDYIGISQYNREQLPTISGIPPKLPCYKVIEDEFPQLKKSLLSIRHSKSFTHPAYFFAEKHHAYMAKFAYIREEIQKIYEQVRRNGETAKDQFERIANLYSKLAEKDATVISSDLRRLQIQAAKDVIEIFEKLATQKHPILFLRAFSTTVPCHKLTEEIERQLRKSGKNHYRVLRYFDKLDRSVFGDGKKSSKLTLKEVLINNYPKNGGNFCLVIASRGRSNMGDSYPSTTGNFIDMKERSCTWNSIIQGTPGRAQGIGKDTTVYMRRTFLSDLRNFIDRGCCDVSKKMGLRDTPRLSSGTDVRYVKPGRPSNYVSGTFNEKLY